MHRSAHARAASDLQPRHLLQGSRSSVQLCGSGPCVGFVCRIGGSLVSLISPDGVFHAVIG